MLIDLNARRAARASAEQDPKILRVGERDFPLVSQIMLSVVDATNDGDLPKAGRMMLANPDEDYEAFIAAVSIDDLAWLISNYGTSLGESDGSTPPSGDTGEPSQPTSDVSTTSASPTVAMEPEPSPQPISSPS